LRFLAYISGAAEHTFAKLLPMVDLGCMQIPQYLGSCDVFLNYTVDQKMSKFCIFSVPLTLAPERGRIL